MAKKFVLGELTDQHEFILNIKEKLKVKTKQSVAYIGVDKLVKSAGVATKAVHFNFEEGQVLTLVFRADGDVIQTKLNNKVVPLLKAMDYDTPKDFDSGLDDLALRLKSNQESFSLKRSKARVIIPRKSTPSLTVKKRIEHARTVLKDLGDMIDQKKALIEVKKQELSNLKQVDAA